jgi:glycosyltransferase involved in cell wall biosynthesis
MIKRISVVAPAYNEEGIIGQFVEKTIKTFKDNALEGEILIVNDCSTDNTKNILEDIAKREPLLRIINNRKNLGLTGAAWTGFTNAKEEIIVFLPSDMESDPEEDIPKLLVPINEGYDMAVGCRQGKKGNLIKYITSKGFNLLARIMFKVKAHDMGWIKAFKKEILDKVELRSDWHRFFVILATQEGYKVKEVKTRFYPRKTGKSKFGFFGFMRLPGGLLDMISIKFLTSFSKKPMFIFGSLGTLMISLGIIGGIYLSIIKIMAGHITERLPLLFLVILLILSGIQLFATGFLAELLVSLRSSIERKK